MTTTDEAIPSLGLQYNPFPPATMGVTFIDDVPLPSSWEVALRQHIGHLDSSKGEKSLVIVGRYGSGKTFILNWLANELSLRRIRPYFFDNPGIAFYDLADRLLRQIGRYELSKAIWEMLYQTANQASTRPRLLTLEFPEWLSTLKDRESRQNAIQDIARAIRTTKLTGDEEIANKFARVVVETREKPYYEYRDFIPRAPNALVAERQEADYFRTLIRLLLRILESRGIALLIDEFEDVALARRLNRRQTSEYMATMRRLLDTARDENLWIILSMTPEGFDQTIRLDPSLVQRFTQKYEIPRLTDQDAHHIVLERLKKARSTKRDDLWPFPEETISELRETTRSSPRRLIKVLWQSIAFTRERNETVPIPLAILREAEEALFPRSGEE